MKCVCEIVLLNVLYIYIYTRNMHDSDDGMSFEIAIFDWK